MTREDTKQQLPLIEAYAEGKTIQYYNIEEKRWKDVDKDPSYCTRLQWRIKPYRSFNNEDECFDEMKKHEPFGWIKMNGEYKHINKIDKYQLYISGDNYSRDYDYLLDYATFADGEPFGIGLYIDGD